MLDNSPELVIILDWWLLGQRDEDHHMILALLDIQAGVIDLGSHNYQSQSSVDVLKNLGS